MSLLFWPRIRNHKSRRVTVVKQKSIAFEDILGRRGVREAWAKLKDVPERDRSAVKRNLEAIANQKRSSYRWHPPSPRDARRLAELLKKAAPKVGRMNLYFGSTLPLGNPDFRKLPAILEQYADTLKIAAGLRKKQRPSSRENWDRELEVVRLLDQCDAERGRPFYIEAVTLIQAARNAAYDAGLLEATEVDPDSLQRAYERQSYRYRRSSLRKPPI
jgi:hypothetical protein